jgi:hypothetical protein
MCLVLVSAVFMGLHPEVGIVVTTQATFKDWVVLKDIFLDTQSFQPEANPASLGHAYFSSPLSTLEDYQNLYDRGLIPYSILQNATVQPPDQWKSNPSLLQKLLTVSMCAYPSAPPGATPTTRSSGCSCIGSTYVDFVRAASNKTVSNISLDIRTQFGNQILSCVDQRQVTKTSTCGKACRLHPLGLILYSNSVIMLTCLAYLVFTFGLEHHSLKNYSTFWRLGLLKTFIFIVGAGLASLYALVDVRSNVLNITGLGWVILNLLYTLHSDFTVDTEPSSPQKPVQVAHPHPFVASNLVNLPLLLPAYTIFFGLSGFARDTFGILIFGVVGGLIGLVFHRYFWTYWYAPASSQKPTLHVLTLCFLCLFANLVLLMYGYSNTATNTVSGHPLMVFVFMVLIFLLAIILNGDRKDLNWLRSSGKTGDNYFSLTLSQLVLLPLLLNCAITIMVCVEVTQT